jgi:hypothetical protein
MGLEYQKSVADQLRQERQEQLNDDQLETNKVSRMANADQLEINKASRLINADQLETNRVSRITNADLLETNKVSRIINDDQLKTNRVSRRILRWTLIVVIIATLISVFSVLSQVFGWLV